MASEQVGRQMGSGEKSELGERRRKAPGWGEERNGKKEKKGY